jgi:hypothetical protein
MKAEDKLAEAKYFLGKLQSSDEAELSFNLSAFVQAWRSVFDVLLYDYAEKYFKCAPARTPRITKDDFKKIAEVFDNLGNSESKRFIEWYEKKESFLGQLHFWHLRKFFVHRGGKKLEPHQREIGFAPKPIEVYVPPSAISAGTIPPYVVYRFDREIPVKTERELAIAGMPKTVILNESKRVYDLMNEIVIEARAEFG